MNYKMIVRMLGFLLLIEAAFMLPCVGIALYDGTAGSRRSFLITMGVLAGAAVILLILSRGAARGFHAREGFLVAGVTWILLALFGGMPFLLSGAMTSPADAFFEAVSGFTTTGASVLATLDSVDRALLYWRCFSNWLGGMGILVFLLAILPAARGDGNSLHILRAESPGPDVGKIMPKMRSHALALYGLYILLTVICLVLLLIGGMPLFDGVCISFGTAGTGGFAVRNDSMASYAPHLQAIVAIFMALFGVNFNVYYLLATRRFRAALRDEEWKAYFGIMLASVALITINVTTALASLGKNLHHVGFTVSSLMTTTGYTTVDYDTWPQFSRVLLLVLMMFGASAGSTAGGIKISRLLLLLKSARRELRQRLNPRAVRLVRLSGATVGEGVIGGINMYITAYIAIMGLSFLLVSLDNLSLDTNLSAVISCLNNVGPALGVAGPTGSYAGFSALSKVVLSADMLLGRLEFIPLLLLVNTRTWSRVH